MTIMLVCICVFGVHLLHWLQVTGSNLGKIRADFYRIIMKHCKFNAFWESQVNIFGQFGKCILSSVYLSYQQV